MSSCVSYVSHTHDVIHDMTSPGHKVGQILKLLYLHQEFS